MSVIDTENYSTVATVDVGTEPQAVVASPNGKFVYVANANDNTVQVIDTSSNTVIATIPVGRSPRALAITNDGDADDLDETLYVPNFFARPRAGFVPPSTANLGGERQHRPSRPEPRASRSSARASSTIRARRSSTSCRPQPTPSSTR